MEFPRFNKLSEEYKRYLGGMLDLRLNQRIQLRELRKFPESAEPDNIFFTPVVIFYSYNRELLDFYSSYFPGHIYPRSKKDGWFWRLAGSIESLEFLYTIRPFTTLIKPQVDIMVEFLEQRDRVRRAREGKRFKRPSQDERIEREMGLYENFNQAKKQAFIEPYLPSEEAIAGMIDLNGGLFITDPQEDKASGYRGILTLEHECKGMLESLEAKYGGTIIPSEVQGYSVWRLSGEQLQNLLIKIESNMLLRRHLVRFMIDFLGVREVLMQPKGYTRYAKEYRADQLLKEKSRLPVLGYYQKTLGELPKLIIPPKSLIA